MSATQKPIIKNLGAGLILRRSSPADAEALAAFCGIIHSEVPGRSDDLIAAWTRDLLTPYFLKSPRRYSLCHKKKYCKA